MPLSRDRDLLSAHPCPSRPVVLRLQSPLRYFLTEWRTHCFFFSCLMRPTPSPLLIMNPPVTLANISIPPSFRRTAETSTLPCCIIYINCSVPAVAWGGFFFFFTLLALRQIFKAGSDFLRLRVPLLGLHTKRTVSCWSGNLFPFGRKYSLRRVGYVCWHIFTGFLPLHFPSCGSHCVQQGSAGPGDYLKLIKLRDWVSIG